MMILLLGSGGQLGRELHLQVAKFFSVYSYQRIEIDINDTKSLTKVVNSVKPDVILNAAAYTNVDAAEHDSERAFMTNAESVKHLAKLANKVGAWLIHYSTDYVFDGVKRTPYYESDYPNPINIYGKSKYFGERAIKNVSERYIIFRTSWVIGREGENFARTILHLAKRQSGIDVVIDQYGVPTSTFLIARVTIDAIKAISDKRSWLRGIYNLVPMGASNRYEMAQTLIAFAEQKGVELQTKVNEIQPILSATCESVAQRPQNSLLNNEKLSKCLSFTLPDWEEDFLQVADQILEDFV